MDALYTAVATATHGREGRAVSSDGKLDLQLAIPVEMGGSGQGTNPEQLFAAPTTPPVSPAPSALSAAPRRSTSARPR